MTAEVLEYAILLANHAAGSENISTNHSWKTGGNLRKVSVSNFSGLCRFLHRDDFFREHVVLSRIRTGFVEKSTNICVLGFLLGLPRTCGRYIYDTHINGNPFCFVGFEKDISKRTHVVHPLNKTTFFIQWSDKVCPDIFQGGLVNYNLPKNMGNIHKRRRLESASFFKNRLIMLLNSIKRASLRRSSFGLHKKG